MKRLRKLMFLIAIVNVSAAMLPATASHNASDSDVPGSKLKKGQQVLALNATDQFGKAQDFASLRGTNGLVLLFFRSADW